MPNVALELTITELIRKDGRFASAIRAGVDWAVTMRAEGTPEAFTRDTIYFRLGQPADGVPVLTPLVKAGIFDRDFTNAKGRPYYKLTREPQEVLTALSRAVGKNP